MSLAKVVPPPVLFAVGDRVAVDAMREGAKVELGFGTVKFVGDHHKSGEPRVGVVLDNPRGKNDGTVGGHTYFACPPNHGTLAKPKFIRKLTMVQLTAAGDINDEYSDDENDPEC